jgi:hypothetical protein
MQTESEEQKNEMVTEDNDISRQLTLSSYEEKARELS